MMLRIVAFFLFVTSLSVPAFAEETRSAFNSATVRMVDVPGGGEQCRGMADIEYSIVNGGGAFSRLDNSYALFPEYRHARISLASELAGRIRDELTSDAENDPTIFQDFKIFYPDGRVEDYTGLIRRSGDPFAGMQRYIRAKMARIETYVSSRYEQRLEALRRRHLRAVVEKPNTSWQRTEDGEAVYLSANPRLIEFYTRQEGRHTCYAASLDTAFRYLGMRAEHDEFISRRADFCPGARHLRRPARLNEILSVAQSAAVDEKRPAYTFNFKEGLFERLVDIEYTQYMMGGRVHEAHSWTAVGPSRVTGNTLLGLGSTLFGLPRITLGKQQTDQFGLPQIPGVTFGQFGPSEQPTYRIIDASGRAIDLWQDFRWSRSNNRNISGYIKPLASTGNILHEFWSGSAIIVGLDGERDGHTVIISALEYSPGLTINEPGNSSIDERTLFRRVWVLDPAGGSTPEREISDVGEFFSRVRFAIAINDGVTTR